MLLASSFVTLALIAIDTTSAFVSLSSPFTTFSDSDTIEGVSGGPIDCDATYDFDLFHCCNGKCTPLKFVNDGDNDCGDYSDEAFKFQEGDEGYMTNVCECNAKNKWNSPKNDDDDDDDDDAEIHAVGPVDCLDADGEIQNNQAEKNPFAESPSECFGDRFSSEIGLPRGQISTNSNAGSGFGSSSGSGDEPYGCMGECTINPIFCTRGNACSCSGAGYQEVEFPFDNPINGQTEVCSRCAPDDDDDDDWDIATDILGSAGMAIWLIVVLSVVPLCCCITCAVGIYCCFFAAAAAAASTQQPRPAVNQQQAVVQTQTAVHTDPRATKAEVINPTFAAPEAPPAYNRNGN